MTELLKEFQPIGGTGNNLIDPSLNAEAGDPELRLAPANFAAGTTDGLVDECGSRREYPGCGRPLAERSD